MSFEGFNPGQQEAAKKILENSSLKDVGFADEGLAKEGKMVHEAPQGSMNSNPYAKTGSGKYQEDEKGRMIVGAEEADVAAKWIEEKGSDEVKKLELI